MLLATRLWLGIVVVLLAGWGPGGQRECEFQPGPERDALVAELVFQASDGSTQTLVEGSDLPLFRAPQGGHILMPSVRVQGVTGCGVIINAALRDPCTNRIAVARFPNQAEGD